MCIEKSTEIQDALKSFWQHEALGMADLPPENPKATSLDQYSTLNDSEFDIKFNGRRYEVKLPWKDDIDIPYLMIMSIVNEDYFL